MMDTLLYLRSASDAVAAETGRLHLRVVIFDGIPLRLISVLLGTSFDVLPARDVFSGRDNGNVSIDWVRDSRAYPAERKRRGGSSGKCVAVANQMRAWFVHSSRPCCLLPV